MKAGFYPALGTPIERDGTFIPKSMAEQIEQQITAGCAGLLVMGSMGNGTYVRNTEFRKVAETSVEAAKGRVPVLVCTSDISIEREMDRIAALDGIKGIDGVVSTVPYYSGLSQEGIFTFYNEVANRSKYPVYLYDLPVVTKTPTLPATVMRLWKNPNIGGIKSGNLVTQRLLLRSGEMPAHFDAIFSNIDEFDIAYKFGVNKNLDGMFSATPKNAKIMYEALAKDDYKTAGDALDNILELRNFWAGTGLLMAAFSQAMTLLGCPGWYGRDYEGDIDDKTKEKNKALLQKIGEI